MTPDQIERTIEFILEHQAKLTASVQKHDEAIAALEKHAARHDQDLQEVTNLIGRLAAAETQLAERMGALAERVDTFAERVDTFAERMDALADAQKETAERLSAFITLVGKYISGRDGGARSGN